ncbi:NAD(P)-dependent dehydrogenase, short-chain alcohol dehydrogenase family [Actinopolyspora mzabensis]|uniref:NAD(P)-dependent dehydrogenase, short-chain alcohol dehydrogenase family n=1 Tax=Actinopolyspora mzabensis TaxID=995066 RepID=A0A1G8YC58_ACTMZ|nr:SDR family oxidoreductase [Actinopolyspora mzabensis]SDJ99640.1 NAD(P)-dependent dehydrogenase, short-chain alcohol dehydrogenase family [Actinopolyspora mzabensis]
MARFTGKRVLITGGTSGIGLAGAHRITDEDGQLVITGTNQQRLTATRQALPLARVLHNDTTDPNSTDALASHAAELGGLDGLWLNAGYADVRDIDEIDADFFDRMMRTNVRGPALQLARLAENLNDGASVVITSSTATYEGAGAASVYAATKGALVAMARGWATALAERGIRVNVLVPGAIDTAFRDFMSNETRKEFERDVVSRVPLNRIGTAEEAAAVALFLLSDDATYITASQYIVDGGLAKR